MPGKTGGHLVVLRIGVIVFSGDGARAHGLRKSRGGALGHVRKLPADMSDEDETAPLRMPSGIGAASKAIIARAIRVIGVVSWRQEEERADTRLILTKLVATAGEHDAFERRDAGAEAQVTNITNRSDQRHPGGARGIEPDDRIGEPAEPFEEVVGVARPAPEPAVHDRRRGLRSAEIGASVVGEAFSGDRRDQNESAQQIANPRPGMPPCAAGKTERISRAVAGACTITRANMRLNRTPHSLRRPA